MVIMLVRRSLAFLFDILIVSIFFAILIALSVVGLYEWGAEENIAAYFFLVFYFILFEGRDGATPGKKLLGVRVVSVDCSRLSYYQAGVRSFVFFGAPILFGLLYDLLGTGFYFLSENYLFSSLGEVELGTRITLILLIVFCRGRGIHDQLPRTALIRVSESSIHADQRGIWWAFLLMNLLVSVSIQSFYSVLEEYYKSEQPELSPGASNPRRFYSYAFPALNLSKSIPNGELYVNTKSHVVVGYPHFCKLGDDKVTFRKSTLPLNGRLVEGGLSERTCAKYDLEVSLPGFLSYDFVKSAARYLARNNIHKVHALIITLNLQRNAAFVNVRFSRRFYIYPSKSKLQILEPDGRYAFSFGLFYSPGIVDDVFIAHQ